MPRRMKTKGDSPFRSGDRIAGRFTVLLLLGSGGFATVWLVRDDEKRHGRYVALRIPAQCELDRSAVAANRLKKWEREQGAPGVFLLELERVFHANENGTYCCQVLPVVGPTLSALTRRRLLLYPSFVKGIAQQLAKALHTMHSLGVCHGDLTVSNIAVKLGRSLDALTDEDIRTMFCHPRRAQADVETADLAMLPQDFLSTNICILDFGLTFLMNKPPRSLSKTPREYLSPESIFALVNGPAADVWAFGIVLFCLRTQVHIFRDRMPGDRDPMGTVAKMSEVLGDLPQEWRTFPFLGGFPVHETLHSSLEFETLATCRSDSPSLSLEQLVDEIVEPHAHTNSLNPHTGNKELWFWIPEFNTNSRTEQRRLFAAYSTPILEDDAALFAKLLRQVFTYDHRQRIKAKQILAHPWFEEPRRRSGATQPRFPEPSKLPIRSKRHAKSST